jgi:diguanylate cyclase (GGDEF)-like protein
MSAHIDASAGDRPGGQAGAPGTVPAGPSIHTGFSWAPGLARALARPRAALQRRGLARALAWLRDPIVVGGAVLLGIGVAVWIVDDVLATRDLPLDGPIALIGAVLLAGRLGARRVRDRTAHLGVLQAASSRMSRAASIEGVGRAVVEETRRIIDYHNARVYIIEPPDQVVPIAFEGRVGAYERVDLALLRTTLGEGFTGWVAEHGIPLVIDDANRDPRGATIPGTDDVDESMLVVPMRYDEHVVGVITLSKLGLRQFDRDDLRLLGILADGAATALQTTRLLARSERLTAELRRLVQMSSELSASLDPRQVADLMATHIALAVGADECAISIWDRDDDRIATIGYHPDQAPGDLQEAFALADFPATRRVLEQQAPLTIQVSDPAADPAEVAYMRQEGFASLVMLPLVAKGRSVGLVELYAVAEVRLEGTALELAHTMANEAAMALDNATLYERARQLADRDPLTGFFNHRYFHERLGEELLRSGRSRAPVSLLMLDLNEFKLVNDTFGHLFGDRVLRWTADLVRASLRASDVPARYGGDEFAVILPETDGPGARLVADRIAWAFAEQAFRSDGRAPVPVGVSVGSATYPLDASSATDLIAAADAALYVVKRERGGLGDVRDPGVDADVAPA